MSEQKKSKRKNYTGLILAGIFLTLALVAGSILLTRHFERARYENYIWENYSVTVTLNYYDGTRKMITTLIGDSVELDVPPEVENHTFLGWENSSGSLCPPSVITVSAAEEYTAKYIISLDTVHHIPYIFPDELGFFHAEEDLTRGEAARMIDALLAEKPKPGSGFVDIEPDSVYDIPARNLRALGLAEGSRFYPDEGVTRGEFVGMLAAFFPPAGSGIEFVDVAGDSGLLPAYQIFAENGWIDKNEKQHPGEILTRMEAVLLLNRVLGRSNASRVTEEMVGGLLEYKSSDPFYLPLAEASVPHTCVADGQDEVWKTSEPFPTGQEGFTLIGSRMYLLDENGHICRNTEQDGFRFGADGVYTSGNTELDILLYEVIDGIYTEGMTREELLHELFEYTISSFTYLRRTYYKYGDTTYAPEAAYVMLSTGKGNCYCYAGTFCMFARALGYDAVVYSGTVGKDREPHGWCEIIQDGVPYICDAELMMRRRSIGGELDMYMKRYEELRGWTYVRYV